MKVSRTTAEIAVAAVVLAAWLAAVVQLNLPDDPPVLDNSGETVVLGGNSRIVWTGENAVDGECTASDSGQTHQLEKGSFAVQTGPYKKYREGIAWLSIECEDGIAARAVQKFKHPLSQSRAEIARLGLNVKEMENWLNQEILPIIERNLEEEYKGKRENVWEKVDVEVLDVSVGNSALKVDEGLIYEASVTVRIKTHDDGIFSIIFDGIEGEAVGYVRLKGDLDLAGKAILVKTDVDGEIIDFDTDLWFGDGAIKKYINKVLDELVIPAIKEEADDTATKQVNTMLENIADGLGPEFAAWLGASSVVPRARAWLEGAEFDTGRWKIWDGGERVEFSISANGLWLGRPAPYLNLSPRDFSEAVTVKVSYAFVNALLETILGEKAGETLAEASQLLGIIQVLGDQQTKESERIQLESGIAEVGRLLRMAGLKLADTASDDFSLPVSVVPQQGNQDGVVISLAGARIIQEAKEDSAAWLSVWAELAAGLGDKPSEGKELKQHEHLRRHFAIVAVPSDGNGNAVPSHLRASAELMTKFATGQHTRWFDRKDGEGEDLLAAFNSLDIIFDSIPRRDDTVVIGELDFKIEQLENDHDEYAFIIGLSMPDIDK